MLSRSEIEKYDRQLILSKFGPEAQSKLKKSKILIVGVGGLGGIASLYLASAGVGFLGIIEFDSVDLSNIHRQILYEEGDCGKSKILLAKDQLQKRNSELKVVTHEIMLDGKNSIKIFSDYDIILDCTDNIKARYLCSDTCAILNKPLIHGTAVSWEGYLTILCNENNPCYRCLFPEAPKYEAQRVAARVGILGITAGIIGQLMAEQAINFVIGNIEGVLNQRMLSFDGKKTKFTEIKLRSKSIKYFFI